MPLAIVANSGPQFPEYVLYMLLHRVATPVKRSVSLSLSLCLCIQHSYQLPLQSNCTSGRNVKKQHQCVTACGRFSATSKYFL
ncbi:hypothetical protein CY35_13G038100 [Sphagnum magellanicum]|nr:hypothetical protein CY35_13G038100 [Sphagnum magellanicum]